MLLLCYGPTSQNPSPLEHGAEAGLYFLYLPTGWVRVRPTKWRSSVPQSRQGLWSETNTRLLQADSEQYSNKATGPGQKYSRPTTFLASFRWEHITGMSAEASSEEQPHHIADLEISV